MQTAVLLASVSIDADPTAFIMAGLFIVLYFVLGPLIINPYMRTREMRREAVDGAREEAAEQDSLATSRMNEFEDEIKSARREASQQRETLRGAGTQEQQKLLDEARDEVQAKLAEERKKIQAQVEAARTELEGRAQSLSAAMVDKILPTS